MPGAISIAWNAAATRLLPVQAYMTSSTIAPVGRKPGFADADARENTDSGQYWGFSIPIL